jgi:hypothetical protein
VDDETEATARLIRDEHGVPVARQVRKGVYLLSRRYVAARLLALKRRKSPLR